MKRLLPLLLLLALAPTPPAGAVETTDFEAKTTRDLVNLCSAPVGDPHYDAALGFCLGFVDGVIDYHRVITSGDLVAPITCPGDMLTRQEVLDAFLDWAKTHGDLLDTESPIQGLMRAASTTWPCD